MFCKDYCGVKGIEGHFEELFHFSVRSQAEVVVLTRECMFYLDQPNPNVCEPELMIHDRSTCLYF